MQKNSKNFTIENIINGVEKGEIPLKEFKGWLATHQLSGNNYFFVFELNKHNFSKEFMINFEFQGKTLTKDIFDYNEDNLQEATLVNIYHDENNGRGILTYICPAEVMKKEKLDGFTQSRPVKHLYFANVIVDYCLGYIVVAINPTANLISVNGVSKDKTGFTPIAYDVFMKARSVLGTFTYTASKWIPEALNQLADEATYHNNPQITEDYILAEPIIEEAVSNLLTQFDLNNPPEFAYVCEEFKQAFENILIDKHGLGEEIDTYKVFEQKGDQVNSFVYVGSKVSYLNEGKVAKVAKATRCNSDLTLLGIEYTANNERYRFYVASGEDHYVIKGSSTKFTKEEVIRDVIKKLDEYRRQIRDTSFSLRED